MAPEINTLYTYRYDATRTLSHIVIHTLHTTPEAEAVRRKGIETLNIWQVIFNQQQHQNNTHTPGEMEEQEEEDEAFF